MRTPKPPTARSVSATLRAHDFRAVTADRDGFLVEWDGRSIRVQYETGDRDLQETAHVKMASALRRKGWNVTECGYLLVTAMEGT